MWKTNWREVLEEMEDQKTVRAETNDHWQFIRTEVAVTQA